MLKKRNGLFKTIIESTCTNIIVRNKNNTMIIIGNTSVISDGFIPDINNQREHRLANKSEWIIISKPQEDEGYYQRGDVFKVKCRGGFSKGGVHVYTQDVNVFIYDEEYDVLTDFAESEL